MSDALNALFHPFDTGVLPHPQPGRGFFLRAEAGQASGVDDQWRRGLVCEQSFKPTHETLRQRGYTVERALSGGGFDVGLCLLTKHKAENLANIGRAWMALRPGGLLVCAGGNTVGAASIERAFKDAVGTVATQSKHHCKIFWSERGNTVPAILADWVRAGDRQMAETGYWSQPGCYNWNKVDAGSALLADHLPANLCGRAADLGAGWGYLSLRLLERAPAIASLDLFEAEGLALEAARANLDNLAPSAKVDFHWHDVTAGLPKRAFDVVVMNPPFHAGKATDMDLGRAFITQAAQALVPGGRLLCVANRQLPYEAVLRADFRRCATIAENGLYKLFLAQA